MKMNKKDHIQYWLKTSENDWKRVSILSKTRDYSFALFSLHLSVEKLAKALWVSENKTNVPPRIHNIITLLKQTSFELTEDDVAYMDTLNFFQLEGRYPDYHGKIKKVATLKLLRELEVKSKYFKKCILEKLG